MRSTDLTGQTFNKLTVLNYAYSHHGKYYNCLCHCGTKTIVLGSKLTNQKTKSCGCYSREQIIKRSTKHGMRHTREYNIWCHMKARCYRKTNTRYKYYGARGIKICDQWVNSFKQFYLDMGDAPDKYTIERINNNGNYEPSNCKWATQYDQVQNSRNCVYITYMKQTKTLTNWAKTIGITKNAMMQRHYRKWPIEKMLKELDS